MNSITDEQWKRYLDRYENLLWKISAKISGDEMTASREDNFSDLTIAALESITGFEKLTGKAFDEAIEDTNFDKYTKTVLWNRKNKKGVPLSKKMKFRNKHFSISGDSGEGDFDIEDTRANINLSSVAIRYAFSEKPAYVKKVINAIVKDPSVVDCEGKVRYHALLRPTGLTIHFVLKAVDEIRDTLNRIKD